MMCVMAVSVSVYTYIYINFWPLLRKRIESVKACDVHHQQTSKQKSAYFIEHHFDLIWNFYGPLNGSRLKINYLFQVEMMLSLCPSRPMCAYVCEWFPSFSS